ncbi:MAG: hypothetical protein M1816_000015 [Peltula sp. TS41687]|nr:MAG: hypothetical protein M1816_000015 [Peltula sp. TS41687]
MSGVDSRIPEPAQPPSIPPRHRPALPQSVSAAIIEPRFKQTTPTSPVNASSHDKRSSQASDAGSPNSGTLPVRERPPPPPPPTEPARPRMVAGDARPPRHPKLTDLNASEGEVTEYDGDYDTDITSSATHKAALSVSTQEQGDDSSNLSGNIAASITNITRPKMAPPIPRLPAPRARRQSISNDTDQPKSPSTDMPRGAPPPIPAAPRHESRPVPTDDYDPYRYPPPVKATPATHVSSYASLSPRLSHERGSDEENLPGSPHLEEKLTPPPRSSQDRMAIPLVPPKVQAFQVIQPHHLSEPMATSPRPSQEVSRPQSSTRRSMDQSRASADQGHIARDIDLGRSSLWWAQPNKPPPAFQNRADLSYEVEESRVSRRGGKTTIARDVYVLFPDYSQTIVTARSDSGAAEDVSLEQRHEPPPARLRQEQFEESQVQFGRRLADDVKAKQNAVVGDGTPQSLVTELLKPLSGALMPVGTRAYGAMIYLNLANASIQQHDEIRPGDVISFRNARFQGHKGTMHQKYSVDVGKPDHVGIVMDWDGTKKKVRAWEQGREGKKVKLESFRLGDLRSGEVKILGEGSGEEPRGAVSDV